MKQKKKMLLGFVLALVALAALYAALTAWNARQAQQAQQEGSLSVLSVSASDLTGLALEYQGETLRFLLQEGQWTLEQDPAYNLNQTLLNSMLTAVGDYTAKRSLSPQEGLDSYGLAEPQATVTLETAAAEYTLLIGAENPVTGAYYVQLQGQEDVYLVEAGKATCFLYDKAGLFQPFSPAAVSIDDVLTLAIQRQEQTITLEKRVESDVDEQGEATTSTAWYLSDGSAANRALANTVLTEALNATAQSQLTDPPQPLAYYGLAEPTASLTATLADGTAVTLHFGTGVDGWYLQREGDASVYAVGEAALQALCYEESSYRATETEE